MESDQTALRLELKNGQLIDAAEYAAALGALADEYSTFVADESADVVAKDVRLYVRELRSGSVIADLIALAPLALPFIENSNSVISFAEHLKTIIGGLLRRTPDEGLSSRSLNNLIHLVEPVARDNAAQFNVQTVIHNQTVHNHLTLTSVEANALQNAARLELEEHAAPATGLHRKVVLYLHQARSDPRSRAGDRAVIESIHPNSVKLVFVDDGLKASVVSTDENPFKSAYLVDVEVETVRGRPLLYKVIVVHERLDLTGEPDAA